MQEEALKKLKGKLDPLTGVGEMNAERKELLIREARIDFDRYLRNFVAESKKRRIGRAYDALEA